MVSGECRAGNPVAAAQDEARGRGREEGKTPTSTQTPGVKGERARHHTTRIQRRARAPWRAAVKGIVIKK